ncbi:MAG: FCD domain-containing protein [Streptosporangiales bacterium]|nr:FCD domain-containing protein [Streptosporangiales bacterium]
MPTANDTVSLGSTAYTVVKRAILRCQLTPGQQVSESQLAGQYGLGRAAVRTALSRLSQEDLVQPVARSGHLIAPITLAGVRDVFDVRMHLEPPAARRAAGGGADLAVLRELELACRAERYEPGDDDAVDRFLRANTALHVGIVAAGGNSRMAGIVRGLLEASERFFHLALGRTDRNDEMYHEHHDLIDAMVAGNPDQAHAVCVEQIEASKRMVVDALLSTSDLRDVNLA